MFKSTKGEVKTEIRTLPIKNESRTGHAQGTGIVIRYCVYDEHLIAGQDIQCRAPDSQSGYTTPI